MLDDREDYLVLTLYSKTIFISFTLTRSEDHDTPHDVVGPILILFFHFVTDLLPNDLRWDGKL